MNKRMWMINLLSVASLLGLGWKLGKDWRLYAAHNGPEALETHPLSDVTVPPPLSSPDYTAIARQNPFNADRNDVIAEPAQAKVIGPPPLVYGSLIFGSTRSVLLGREQSPKAEQVAEGSTFDGYRVVHVLPESVVLESSAGQEEIMFYNAMQRLRRQAIKTSASARPGSQPPGAAPDNGASPPIAAVTNVGSASPALSPAGQATTAKPAPAGKEWVDTPFGAMLFNKKAP
jgi:hypothetical protein